MALAGEDSLLAGRLQPLIEGVTGREPLELEAVSGKRNVGEKSDPDLAGDISPSLKPAITNHDKDRYQKKQKAATDSTKNISRQHLISIYTSRHSSTGWYKYFTTNHQHQLI